jgi:hypothetical protein
VHRASRSNHRRPIPLTELSAAVAVEHDQRIVGALYVLLPGGFIRTKIAGTTSAIVAMSVQTSTRRKARGRRASAAADLVSTGLPMFRTGARACTVPAGVSSTERQYR